jgi:hypothetical protein
MDRYRRQYGFSLTETLMAVATLAIGMSFIAGTFLTGIYFSTVSTERTVAAVAADEAFAKVRLYGLDPNHASLKTDGFVPYEQLVAISADELRYPSTGEAGQKQYSWSMLCRRMGDDSRLVQCAIFICRQAGAGTMYWNRKSDAEWPQLEASDLPRPIRVTLARDAATADANEVLIKDAVPSDTTDELAFVNDGSTLMNDKTGELYRVLERYADRPDRIKLNRPWNDAAAGDPAADEWVWVVPPAVSGGRNCVVAVYQKVLRLSDE